MDANLNLVVEQVSKDKGIEPDILQRALEEAILVAAKRTFGAERNLQALYNLEKGAVDLTQTIIVVENVEDAFNEISVEDCTDREIDVEIGDERIDAAARHDPGAGDDERRVDELLELPPNHAPLRWELLVKQE